MEPFLTRPLQIDIVVVSVPRYRCGHEAHFVPPVTGIHLAALTPAPHRVRVIHQQVEPIDPAASTADLIALTFFSGFAGEAYRLAAAYRRRGVPVVAGGPHVTFAPLEAAPHFDAIVTGEAEAVWPQVLADAAAGGLRPRYDGGVPSLDEVPTPRYDLLPATFVVPRVVQATRGCPHRCSFCSVPRLNPGFRMRPVEKVLADIRYERFRWWWQRKIVWFWDDNLTANRPYIKRLLREMVPLKRWWLTQAGIDIARDDELLDLLRESGCIGIFFGLESFGAASLADARKPQNLAADYAQAIARLHARGICVMAGFISGFDGDTPASIEAMADRLEEVGVDVPYLSILTPYRGTPAWERFEREGRLLPERDWEFFNGFNVAFAPVGMSPRQLLSAHRRLWHRAFSLRRSLRRIWRAARRLRVGAFLMCLLMNAFYGLKHLRRNAPIDFTARNDAPRKEADRQDVGSAPLPPRIRASQRGRPVTASWRSLGRRTFGAALPWRQACPPIPRMWQFMVVLRRGVG
jgi:radical SAM superfamily enzyme YgiQ (UPF0313 family)